MGWEVGGAAEHGLQPRAAAAWEGITSYQGSITGLGAGDSIAQKLGKNQGLFQGAGSRPATPSPTPDTVLSREQLCSMPCVSAQGSKTHMHTPLLSQEDTPQLSSVRKGWGGILKSFKCKMKMPQCSFLDCARTATLDRISGQLSVHKV